MVRFRTMIAAGIVATAAAAGISYANETVTYTYDARGRLIRVQHSGSINNNLIANYTFDDAGNRKSLKVTGSPNPP